MNTSVEAARAQMINQQVRAWSVLDPAVLAALAALRREDFVPPAYRSVAFADTAVPIGHGQVMMTPQVEGRLLQALSLTPSDRVLEIGTGSGFLAGCLAQLAAAVTSLELIPALATGAERNLRSAGCDSVTILNEDAFRYQPTDAFDAIAITGSLPRYDARFASWLRPGGRLFIVCGEPPLMEAMLVRASADGTTTRHVLFETVLPPLTNAPHPQKFVF